MKNIVLAAQDKDGRDTRSRLEALGLIVKGRAGPFYKLDIPVDWDLKNEYPKSYLIDESQKIRVTEVKSQTKPRHYLVFH